MVYTLVAGGRSYTVDIYAIRRAREHFILDEVIIEILERGEMIYQDVNDRWRFELDTDEGTIVVVTNAEQDYIVTVFYA